ncbi:alpha/beta-Hydrolases superfamily protein [Actinidia rufa]|uniref:Alpha/beta-Hydrolases superfamily protein n=1 Tax=Actinidia rufa TaxID=165716 RepID=A0A7J0DAZ2_9ERIC|nr:alpha/beta-Hydrolases superfamily protein [Actinidia rufa]
MEAVHSVVDLASAGKDPRHHGYASEKSWFSSSPPCSSPSPASPPAPSSIRVTAFSPASHTTFPTSIPSSTIASPPATNSVITTASPSSAPSRYSSLFASAALAVLTTGLSSTVPCAVSATSSRRRGRSSISSRSPRLWSLRSA